MTPASFAPQELRFAPTHEWVHVSAESGAKVATVGVSAFAVAALTDLVYIELPAVGRTVKSGESFGEIESVKAVSDLYSPIDGEITETNLAADDGKDPKAAERRMAEIKDDPYGKGWLLKITYSESQHFAGLMSYDEYQKQCAEEGH